jgi:hypothetical protein
VVIVRKMPDAFEGERVRTCCHYQWVWCPGVQNNVKCQVRDARARCGTTSLGMTQLCNCFLRHMCLCDHLSHVLV